MVMIILLLLQPPPSPRELITTNVLFLVTPDLVWICSWRLHANYTLMNKCHPSSKCIGNYCLMHLCRPRCICSALPRRIRDASEAEEKTKRPVQKVPPAGNVIERDRKKAMEEEEEKKKKRQRRAVGRLLVCLSSSICRSGRRLGTRNWQGFLRVLLCTLRQASLSRSDKPAPQILSRSLFLLHFHDPL
jgi:hypothetical protein